MERYITFIRNNKTGEEFITTCRALPGAHANIMLQEGRKYPAPQYQVHTVYTDKELRDMLETLDRWTGTKVMEDTPRLSQQMQDIPRLISKI